MKASRLLVLLGGLALLLSAAGSASAQSITLEFKDGRVNLTTQNAPVTAILAEWARRGKTTIINGERVPGAPATLQLTDVPEQEALDIVLRGASGYMMAARETPMPGVSAIDRILILPTSRVTSGQTQQPQVLQPPAAPQAAIQEDDDDGPPPGPGPRPGQNFPPGVGPTNPPPGVTIQNLPPGVRVPGQLPPSQLPPTEEPETRPAPAPNNPFGVAPGSSQPGVITPAPTPQRQR